MNQEISSKNTIESFMLLVGIDAYEILPFKERNELDKEAYERADKEINKFSRVDFSTLFFIVQNADIFVLV